jgi:pilus assembly protein Flp/PilA
MAVYFIGWAMGGFILRFVRNESAATAIEYGLIAALIAIVIITAITSVGTKLSTTFTAISAKI